MSRRKRKKGLLVFVGTRGQRTLRVVVVVVIVVVVVVVVVVTLF